ncbi:uncharacterized protein LOC129716335 [Leucoraja erinacea]|uniref:uncharacterized protein LOC129716335 n=1 Tax=Leucoraja erinaceus TaxID=7782 RepID=UPI00245839C4|nr:uncharacterized protein LOC129716335 [Leucoraja erinacea]
MRTVHLSQLRFVFYFFQEETGRKQRVRDEAKPLSVVDEALPIEKFHCSVSFNTALKETSDDFRQVSVTLDVETAHAQLEVSEDRKRVRWTGTERSLPDTGKRFTGRACVLGSEGFTSGRHYWEVEVAGSECWSLGVAAESVERKGRVTLTPETGVWSIWRWVTGLMHSPPLHPVSPPVPSPGGWEFISVTSPGQFHFTTRTPSPISTPSLGINSRRNFILSSGDLGWKLADNLLRFRSGCVKGSGPGTGVRSGAQGLWGRNPVDNRSALNGSHLIPKFRVVKPQ